MGINLKRLRDIICLLDSESPDSPASEKERRQELLKEYQWLWKCARTQSDYFHFAQPYQVNYTSNIIPRFIQLLRESVLTHSWQEALRIVERLIKEPKGSDDIVWKIGLACLLPNGGKHNRLIEQFIKHLYRLQSVAVVEVLYDYLLFLLSQQDLKEAKNLVQNLKQGTVFRDQLVTPSRKNAQVLFDAYQGLVLYAEWKLMLYKQNHEDEYSMSQMLSQGALTRQAEETANMCLEILTSLKDKPGVWDIFISRASEIHIYYDRHDEARKLLQTYRETNPGNPNAHKYLYDLETEINGDRDIRIDCLKEIVKLDPCNPKALDLFRLTELSDPRAVTLLFDYLDFNHCKNDETAWNALAQKLGEIPYSKDLKKAVKASWKVRKDWWPNTVFQDVGFEEDNIFFPAHDTSSQATKNISKYKRTVINALKSIRWHRT